MAAVTNTILLLCLMTLAAAKPIMVTFGTNQGPIVPPTERSVKPVPRTLRDPAPVSEEREDLPNPQVYRAPVPHQYRDRIYQSQPSSFIVGTPIDRKYTPSVEKYEIYRKQARVDSAGAEYTGPHVFEKQDYEVVEDKKAPVRYIKPHYYQQEKVEQEQDRRVPQIGVIYSAGVRYYVPQLAYDDRRQEEDEENSVYDNKDEKYFYRKEQ